MEQLHIEGGKAREGVHISLTGSKSISNRILIIRALGEHTFPIENLSKSQDTLTLEKLLSSNEETLDAGHAGTTFRFLTSYLCLQEGKKTLTGSDRMLERPIGPLVDALRSVGADIEYLGKEGFPPLQISGPLSLTSNKISISGKVSSQFLSSLLLIAPYLSEGLELEILDDLVSRPYLEMTLKLMELYGASFTWENNIIKVQAGQYISKDFFVEGDWSSASYHYIAVGLSDVNEVVVEGLSENSIQGDARIVAYAKQLGIETQYVKNGIKISKDSSQTAPDIVEYNLIEQPDLCQSLACLCAGLGVSAMFSGLQTLHIKETDRIAALKNELEKFNVSFAKLPPKFSPKSDETYYLLQGKITKKESSTNIATYHDHRMAMAFAPLSSITKLTIEDPLVIVKSYPDFWNDMQKYGYKMSNLLD